jgi:hypothetical protein
MKETRSWIGLGLAAALGLAACNAGRTTSVATHASGPQGNWSHWPSGAAGGAQPAPPHIAVQGQAEAMSVASGRNWSPEREPPSRFGSPVGQSAGTAAPATRPVAYPKLPAGLWNGQGSDDFATDRSCDSWETSPQTRARFGDPGCRTGAG